MHWHKFPRSIVNQLSVPCRMRIPAEKRFLTMRGNLLHHIPISFLRFPLSIGLCSSTFPLLRRPRSTIILLCIIWSWRLHKFPRSIVTCNRFSRILISIRGPLRVWWSWRRHERKRSCGQIHHGSWFGSDTSFSWFLLSSFCHRCDASSRTKMADIKQRQQMILFITCEIPLCQYVSKLVLGVNIFDLNLGVQIFSIKQPIKSNSVGSGNMSHCWTSAFHNHFNYTFIVLKHIQ